MHSSTHININTAVTLAGKDERISTSVLWASFIKLHRTSSMASSGNDSCVLCTSPQHVVASECNELEPLPFKSNPPGHALSTPHHSHLCCCNCCCRCRGYAERDGATAYCINVMVSKHGRSTTPPALVFRAECLSATPAHGTKAGEHCAGAGAPWDARALSRWMARDP